MQVTTFEGVIEGGIIRLRGNVKLPERTRVYVIVPNLNVALLARIASPRLAHPEQAVDFVKEVVEIEPDGTL